MIILGAAMLLLPPVLVTLYLYVSGVFTNRSRFQSTSYIVLILFALSIGFGTQLSYQRLWPSGNNPSGIE